MSKKEDFNQPQKDSEELAKIALGLIHETWGQEVKSFGDLVGVIQDGIFYTATIDGVGAKLEIAQRFNSFYELGIDVVNSQTNDLVRFGVKPNFFLSLVSTAGKNEGQMEELVKGMVSAAKNVCVPIIGGETEVLRRVLFKSEDKINVAVAAFGWQEVSRFITRENIEHDDALLVLPSSGLHNNGFSEIVARIDEIDLDEILYDLSRDYDQTVEEWLKKPTANYLEDFKLLQHTGIRIKAAEAVTGGGFSGRLSKLLEISSCEAKIQPERWPLPPIFEYLKLKFGWSDEQMNNTYNMGAGMFLVISQEDSRKAIDVMVKAGRNIFQIGKVESALYQAKSV